MDPPDLSSLEGETLVLCAPLTPTKNIWERMAWPERQRYRRVCMPIIRDQLNRALGIPRPSPWAERIRLDVVRCSMGTRAADPTNLEAGVNPILDLLRSGSSGVMAYYLIHDDSAEFVVRGDFVDEPRGSWSRPGPGTWMLITRMR